MIKIKLIPIFIAMMLASQLSSADNIIRMKAPIITVEPAINLGAWESWQDIVGEWASAGEVTNCSNWTPSPSTVNDGQTFTQTANDCQQTQQRSIQSTERNTQTLAIRNAGTPIIETRVVQASSSRSATGIKKTISATAEFVVTIGNTSGQWGYMPNTGKGVMISSSNPDYMLNYISLGFSDEVLIGVSSPSTSTRITASRYHSIEIQMADSSGSVFYTMSSENIVDNYNDPPYFVGWKHNTTDYANAKLAKRFFVTLNFN